MSTQSSRAAYISFLTTLREKGIPGDQFEANISYTINDIEDHFSGTVTALSDTYIRGPEVSLPDVPGTPREAVNQAPIPRSYKIECDRFPVTFAIDDGTLVLRGNRGGNAPVAYHGVYEVRITPQQ
ncbi:hypothetical protein AA13594_2251 [Gluconacetobacter azotocaptans DSM 13594]|nr:hypothetical protein AA13594_2251 [Gluconacetobacter azotocaptans DSM 13594]